MWGRKPPFGAMSLQQEFLIRGALILTPRYLTELKSTIVLPLKYVGFNCEKFFCKRAEFCLLRINPLPRQ